MIPLLDVNVLVALAWPRHIHHAAARRWLAGESRFATSPCTQVGFLRVSTNNALFGLDTPSPGAACSLLEAIARLPTHVFWPEDVSPATDPTFQRLPIIGSKQVPDAWLLAIAAARGGQLATLDRRMVGLAPPGSPLAALVRYIDT
jgi:toxin-antitoxin system PIN domain toxin